VALEDEERALLLPAPTEPYDIPLWKTVTVGRDHHVSVGQALYFLPAERCPPGTSLEARADRCLLRLYHHGELVKVHPRQEKGSRSTDVADYPPERAAYAQRAPEQILAQARALGEPIGQFAERLLSRKKRIKGRQRTAGRLSTSDYYQVTPGSLRGHSGPASLTVLCVVWSAFRPKSRTGLVAYPGGAPRRDQVV
jgi:hypothetical protein